MVIMIRELGSHQKRQCTIPDSDGLIKMPESSRAHTGFAGWVSSLDPFNCSIWQTGMDRREMGAYWYDIPPPR